MGSNKRAPYSAKPDTSKKQKRFAARPPHVEWPEEDIELVLSRLLPCQREGQFKKLCKALANGLQRGGAGQKSYSGDTVRRLVWGIAIGSRGYTPPASRSVVDRGREEATWMELQMVRWAVQSISAEAERQAAAERLAPIICRPVDWVLSLVRRHNPMAGHPGFGFNQ